MKHKLDFHKEAISPDTKYIQLAISNKDDIRFFTMVDAEKMNKVFNNALNSIVSTSDEKLQLKNLIMNSSELPPEKPWEYTVSIDDTARIDKLFNKFKAEKIIPLNYNFSWSYINLDTSRISIFIYESYNIKKNGFLTSSDISDTYKAYDENSKPVLIIRLKNKSIQKFKIYTREKIGLYYGVFIRNRLLVYRYIRYEIHGGVIMI